MWTQEELYVWLCFLKFLVVIDSFGFIHHSVDRCIPETDCEHSSMQSSLWCPFQSGRINLSFCVSDVESKKLRQGCEEDSALIAHYHSSPSFHCLTGHH